MGTMEATCGAPVGAGMMAGLKTKGSMTGRVTRQITETFRSLCGAVTCRDLKGISTGWVLCPCDESVLTPCRLTEKVWSCPEQPNRPGSGSERRSMMKPFWKRWRTAAVLVGIAGILLFASPLSPRAAESSYACRPFSDETVALTRCEGTEEWVEVPSVWDGKTVVAVEEGCFEHHPEIFEIVLPDSVTSIGRRAFADCENLTEVAFPKTISTVGKEAFADCPSLSSIRFYGTPDEFLAISMDSETRDLLREKLLFYKENPLSPEEVSRMRKSSAAYQTASAASPEENREGQFQAMMLIAVAALILLVAADLILRRKSSRQDDGDRNNRDR